MIISREAMDSRVVVEAGSGYVVGQGVPPDVHTIWSASPGTGIPQPPARAAGRETLKSDSRPYEGQHFVAPGGRLDPYPPRLENSRT